MTLDYRSEMQKLEVTFTRRERSTLFCALFSAMARETDIKYIESLDSLIEKLKESITPCEK